ncbi:GNAT family N-acetyltransferase [Cellulomonas sp. ICMP 17802]|uniref:GNAT family N-acetyltransferase n=1 Tax=Cellulomonas sp. ICMP 17802 TaxID=3239199 RepID=UPI00351BE7EB
MTDLADLWPLAALRVTCGDLELRYLDESTLTALAQLAAEGIHDPDFMPFTGTWSRGTPTEVARSVLTFQWGKRAATTPDDWHLDLALVRGGEVLGVQGMMAKAYPVTRTAETGSWLGRRHQGQGLGTRMRLMILHLLFEGLGAHEATTQAFADNAASNGVTRRLGYAENGVDIDPREGKAVLSNRYVLSLAAWQSRPEAHRLDVTLDGVGPAREFLGIV